MAVPASPRLILPLGLILVCGTLWTVAITPHVSAQGYTCPADADYTGASLPPSSWLQTRDSSHQPALSPPPAVERKFLNQLEGRHRCPQEFYTSSRQEHSGTTVIPRGRGLYELRDFCIRPMFEGGVTLHRPRDAQGHVFQIGKASAEGLFPSVRGGNGGLEVCNEFACAAYPVSESLRAFPCSGAKWVEGASAVILPLTNGNPWHLLHHLLPLTHVLEENRHTFKNGTVHLYTTLFARPQSAQSDARKRHSRRYHPFPARTYFSPWHIRWWPLLGAALPPGLSMVQVDHLELLPDDPQFAVPHASPSVCYTHGFLGVPQMYEHDTAAHPRPLVAPRHIHSFRERALRLAGVGGGGVAPEEAGRCVKGLFGASRAPPLLGLIVRKGTRKLCNLKEMAQAAGAAGFHVELVSLEEMDVLGQIRTARRYDLLAGVHGAGMTNVLWLRNSSVALEMYPAMPNERLREGENVNPGSNYGRFAALSGARHVVWLQKIPGVDTSSVPFRTLDVSMDVKQFTVILQSLYRAWQARPCM